MAAALSKGEAASALESSAGSKAAAVAETNKRILKHGLQRGEVTLSLIWDTTDDLDLHLALPDGREVSWEHQEVGGAKLLGMNGELGAPSDEPIEHLYFPVVGEHEEAPPVGEYRAFLEVYKKREARPVRWHSVLAFGATDKVAEGIISGGDGRVNIGSFMYESAEN